MKVWLENRAEMEHILERALVGRLGLITDDGPYIVPLNFAYGDGCIYFHTGLEGRKLEAMRKNPRVCFEVDELLDVVPHEKACRFTTYYRSVIMWGMVRFLETSTEKLEALERLLTKYAAGKKYSPVPEDKLDIVTVCEIRINTMTGKASLPDAGPG